MTQEQYGMWLCSIEGIGSHTIQKLINCFGTPEEVYTRTEEQLKEAEIGARERKLLINGKRQFHYRAMKQKISSYDMDVISYFSERYPEKLRHIPDFPKRLYWRGKLPRNSAEICYPKEHARLYQSIVRNGGVLSEYPPETPAMPGFFPMRNRIISALSDGVLIVEAREKSGSLITAELALEQGKDIFVIPGRIGDTLSEGCNQWIRQGAYLVTKPSDIVEYYEANGLLARRKKSKNLAKIKVSLESEEKMVYASLSLEPKEINQIAKETALPSALLMKQLFSLQKRGLVKEVGKNNYIKI